MREPGCAKIFFQIFLEVVPDFSGKAVKPNARGGLRKASQKTVASQPLFF
jgi:hypothetical protein